MGHLYCPKEVLKKLQNVTICEELWPTFRQCCLKHEHQQEQQRQQHQHQQQQQQQCQQFSTAKVSTTRVTN